MYCKALFLVFIIIFSQSYGAQTPQFIQKYAKTVPPIEPVLSDDCSIMAKKISDYFCTFIPTSKKSVQIKEKEALENKITMIIKEKKALSLLVLGFPFKSTNHEKKCLSAHVDMAEYLSMVTLQTMVNNINSVYPNTHCTIISDGLAYHIDEYDPSYENILAYHDEMNNLLQEFPRPIVHFMGNQQPHLFV